MNLWATIDLLGGGPGSGCRGPNCGRPFGNGTARIAQAGPKKPGKWRQYDPKKVGGYFKQGTVIAEMYRILADKAGEYHEIREFDERFRRTGMPVIMNRLKELKYTGKRSGRWALDIIESKGLVRMRLLNPPAAVQKSAGETPSAKQNRVENPANAGAIADIEQTLRNGKIIDEKYRGGGVNKAQIVTFEDGSKGVLKYGSDTDSGRRSIIQGKGPQREAAAYEVAKLVGMTDMVPVTVLRTRSGEITSIQEFRPGKEAADKPPDVMYDGNKDAARAAAFDYVIGNEDRHQGNWMLSKEGKMTLIDHGLSFPEKTNGMDFNQLLIGHAQDKDFLPRDQATPFVENKAAIVSALKGVGLRDAAINGVADRIDNLANATGGYDTIAPNDKAKATWRNGGRRPWAFF